MVGSFGLIVSMWLGLAVIGLAGLLHAGYSSSRHYYLGFVVALFSAAGIATILGVIAFS